MFVWIWTIQLKKNIWIFFKSLGIYDVKNIFNILYKLFLYCILLIILCCFINIVICLTLPVRNVLKTGRVWASFSPIRFAGKTQQQHLLSLNPLGPFVQTGYPRRPDATPAKRSFISVIKSVYSHTNSRTICLNQIWLQRKVKIIITLRTVSGTPSDPSSSRSSKNSSSLLMWGGTWRGE